jgi:zinc transport system permease protein
MTIRMITRMAMTTTTSMTMLDDFLVRAGLAGIGLSLATGPLGSFVVWRRMAYFGDATAHAAILGVALALATELPIGLGTLFVALAMAATVSTLSAKGWAMDTTLGVLAHSALAVGLVAVSFLPTVRVDLSAYLFGDILAVSRMDLLFIWGGAGLVLALLAWRWQALLTALAVVVAVALKVVGALLIAAMLIIPAAAARGITRTPEAMAVVASLIGIGAVLAGLWGSLTWDTPAGPSIIVAATAVFVGSAAAMRRV